MIFRKATKKIKESAVCFGLCSWRAILITGFVWYSYTESTINDDDDDDDWRYMLRKISAVITTASQRADELFKEPWFHNHNFYSLSLKYMLCMWFVSLWICRFLFCFPFSTTKHENCEHHTNKCNNKIYSIIPFIWYFVEMFSFGKSGVYYIIYVECTVHIMVYDMWLRMHIHVIGIIKIIADPCDCDLKLI